MQNTDNSNFTLLLLFFFSWIPQSWKIQFSVIVELMGHFSRCWDVHPLHSSAKITPLHKDLHIQSTWHVPQELCPGSPRWRRETGTSRGCFFPHTLNTYFRWDKSLLKVDHIPHQLKVSSYFQVAKIKMNMCQSTGGSEGIKTDLKTSFFLLVLMPFCMCLSPQSSVQDSFGFGPESNSALQAAWRLGGFPGAAVPQQPGANADHHPGSTGSDKDLS